MSRWLAVLCIIFLCAATTASAASGGGDWPMWRYDAGHTAASGHDLPESLHPAWSRHYGPRVPVWDDPLNQDMMPYDSIFEPVVADGKMFVGFNNKDKVVALDIRNGEELWAFYADGPVRFSPVVFDGKVYFASDDGYLYGLDVSDGRLRWKFRGGPSARKMIGNSRLISAWPARGGPVERDGTIYFAASIWPFMGTFIYALDAEDGKVQWVNDATSADFIKQPHSAPAFAGVAPQGQLAATADLLLVPGGRSLPAALDRATGELKYFDFGGKGQGGSFVAADEARCFVHTRLRGTMALNLTDGRDDQWHINEPVLAGGITYAANTPGETDGKPAPAVVQAFDRDKKLLWQVEADGSGDLIKAGNRLYAAGTKGIVAIDLPGDGGDVRVAGVVSDDTSVARLLAGGGMLFAVTREGRIRAWGAEEGEEKMWADVASPVAPNADAAARARRIVQQTGVRQGYALCFGADDPERLEAHLMASDLHMIVVDPDPRRIDRLRRGLDAAGLYGDRAAVCVGDPLSFQPPPYFASLIVVTESPAQRLAESQGSRLLTKLYESLRPYGGVLHLAATPSGLAALEKQVLQARLPKAKVARAGTDLLVTREGSLPGAADWTHAYGDIANTVKSDDQRVRLPLGLLWFGGSSNLDVLPRHGHGPSPQVVGGRLFIQGMNSLSARDVYTGRMLWKREFDDLGTFNVYYDDSYADTPLSTAYNQLHLPGANARGTNYVASREGVYVAIQSRCLLLDPATGKTVRSFELPEEKGRRPEWGFLGVYENLLLAGIGFGNYSQRLDYEFTPEGKRGVAWSPDRNGSLGLLAFDRHTGEVLWKADAVNSLLHNGIVAGRGRIYCLDSLPSRVETQVRRRGETPPRARLLALEASTGKLLWERPDEIAGTWLGYSEQHDVLLEAGAAATDRSPDESAKGMTAFRGVDGTSLWTRPELAYAGPCMIHNDILITNATSYRISQGAFRLLDGEPVTIPHPVTGEPVAWNFIRTYGCNTCVAAEHLLTFRSGAAGFYDLTTHSGTGNFGGFKSGCSSNLIVADGVLSAPEYTRTCTCAYQNQTSLALVPMPEVEQWTYSTLTIDEAAPVRRIGVNLGAPGDRRAEDGTLWIDHPSVGGTSPEIPVEIEGELRWFRHHSARVSGPSPAWIAASGVEGARKLTLSLGSDTPRDSSAQKDTADGNAGNRDAGSPGTEPQQTRTYTVRLHFVEPDTAVRPSERVFRVLLQGKTVLDRLDVIAETGTVLHSITKSFSGVPIADKLAVELEPLSSRAPVLCGVEVAAEQEDAGFDSQAANHSDGPRDACSRLFLQGE